MQDKDGFTRLVRAGLLLPICAALAGCIDTLTEAGLAPEASAGSMTAADAATRDSSGGAERVAPQPAPVRFAAAPGAVDPALVPDPEAFSTELDAVWDGLPTLQGVWVAHPLASRARRVRLTNEQTGAQVDGALFRRDPNQGGPTTVISSEAAEMLGIEPGAATPVSIVAIAYQNQIMQPTGTVAPASPEVVADTAGADATSEAAADTVATAAAETASASAASVETESTETASAVATPTEVLAAETPAAETPAAQATATDTSATESASMAVAAAEPASAEPASVQPASVQPGPVAGRPGASTGTALPGPAAEPAVVAAATAATPAQADVAPTDAVADLAPGTAAPVAAPAAPPRLAMAASAPAPSGTAAATGDGLRFIQAGIFGDAANAERLVERLRASGLPAQAIPMGAGTRNFTRVLVGPFDTAAGRDAALQTVRTIGPADAMPVGG